MDYSAKTHALIERMCRNVERTDFVLDKEQGAELIMRTYDLFNLSQPKNIVWCVDLTDERYQEAAWSASSASSARSARSASSASSALDYDFDWFVYSYEYSENQDGGLAPNNNDRLYLEYSELLLQAKEAGVGYRVEWEDTLYLVPTPLVLIDEQNRFHDNKLPSIRWKGGQEIYHLHGVQFPVELFKKVTSGEMPFADILAIEDIDQRTQAMRYGDVNEFLRFTKAEKLDYTFKITPDDKKVHYALYRIPQGDVFTKDAYYAVYDCPSTDRVYMSGVPDTMKTVAEAMAWKQSDDVITVTPTQWEAMKPLVHES